MDWIIGIVLAGIVAAGGLLFRGRRRHKAQVSAQRQRQVRHGDNSGETSICRYGVNAAGEITRVHVRVPKTRQDGVDVVTNGREQKGERYYIPDFLRER